GLDSPLVARDITDRLLPNLRADRGFDRPALNQLVKAFVGFAEGGGHGPGLEFGTLPWTEGPRQGGQDVLYVKHPDADAVLARLRTFGASADRRPASLRATARPVGARTGAAGASTPASSPGAASPTGGTSAGCP